MKAFSLLFLTLIPLSGILADEDFDPFNLPSAKSIPKKEETQATLLSENSTIAPGQPFTVALNLIHPEGWHSYYVNTGLIGEVLETEWTLPEGFSARSLGWPTPHLSSSFGFETIGYEGAVYHLYEITPPGNLTEGESARITISSRWQICDDKGCISEKTEQSLNLPIAAVATIDASLEPEFARARAHYPEDSKDLSITATEAEDIITVSISPAGNLDPNKLKFFDEDAQVTVQAPHVATQELDTITLKLPRNQGNEFADPGPVLDDLTGILTDGTTSYYVETPRSGAAEAKQVVTDSYITVAEDTPEEIAEMALLYDPSKKIDFVTLKETATTTIWTALFGAFVGGILLNLMPCVFPVLGLKVMGFVEQAGNEPRKIRLHGIAFAAGLVASMWVLAGFILFLKISLGKDVNWGQQMGNPYFVGAIILLLFVLGLNMAGVFEMGTSLTSAGQKVKKKGYSGSFFSGVLTTLIATPCSGPFLGAAMSYTLAQPAGIALFLFTVFALGIALPYLLLSFFPALIQKLPRPGAWMETFKITMSFALFATVAFFMKTFGAQTGADGLALMVMALVIIGLALYFFGHWSLPHRKPKVRLWLGKALPLAIGAGGLYLLLNATQTKAPATTATHGWVSWKPGKVELSRSKKRIVWVDYTADW